MLAPNVHSIDGSSSTAIKLSDLRTIIRFPVANLVCGGGGGGKFFLGECVSWRVKGTIASVCIGGCIYACITRLYSGEHAGVKRHLSVCPSGDDLTLVRTVAHSTEHGIGKDDLAPYKPPAKRGKQLVIVGRAPRVDTTYVRSQMMQVPSLLAVTHCMRETTCSNTHSSQTTPSSLLPSSPPHHCS